MKNCMLTIGVVAIALAIGDGLPAACAAGATTAGDEPAPVWRPELEPNAWTEITPKYTPPPGGGSHHPVSWNKLVYDSMGKRIINIDRWAAPGRIEGTYIYANSLMALDLGKNQIERLSLFNWKKEASAGGGYRTVEMPENKTEPTPLPRHPYGDVAFVPAENAVYLGAGANQTMSSDGKARHPNDTWRFDLATNKWEQIKGEQPPASVSDCMTYVPDVNAIVRWVSSDGAAWFLDLKTRTWSREPIADSPRLGLRTAMAYDSRRKQVLLYGGQVLGKPFGEPGPQLWSLSITDLKWKRLPDGPPASAPGWAYSPRHDASLCWRKINPKTWDTGECWVYFPGEQKWLKMEFPKPVPPKLYQNLTYDESRDVFVCHTRDPKWYVMRLVPAKLNGVPSEYVKRMEQEAAGHASQTGNTEEPKKEKS